MSIDAISANVALDTMQASQDTSETKFTATTQQELNEIEQKVKSAGSDMNAQQISNKYEITLSEAQKILDDLSDRESNNMPETSTMQFSV